MKERRRLLATIHLPTNHLKCSFCFKTIKNPQAGGWWGGGLELTRASVLSSNFVLLFQIIVNQKEPDHPSFYINIRSKGTFSS